MEEHALRLGVLTDWTARFFRRRRGRPPRPRPDGGLSVIRLLRRPSSRGRTPGKPAPVVTSRSAWWWTVLALWVSAWSFAAVCILVLMSNQATARRREALAGMCDERARMLQDQFNVSVNHIQALAILVSTFAGVDQPTFALYADRTAFERPLTSGVAYAVRVHHADRDAFERRHGWTIKTMYAAATVRRDDADEYAPVIFAQEAYRQVISVDLLSGKDDRENILRARESGKGVLTAPFKLINGRLGVILTYAVYESELATDAAPADRVNAAVGYLGGIFDVEALVDKLLHQLACKHAIMVEVFDMTDGEVCMYCVTDAAPAGAGRPRHVSPLNFGDPMRRHEMRCSFTQGPPPSWLAITTSLGTLVIALLVGHIFHATVSRIAKVEDDYRQMMELKRRAEAADVAKSQFLATVSHEIRTPMNGVLGMLQMLMDTNLDATQQDYVRTAQGSGKALVSLINEVLDQAKIESGKLELESVAFDLRAVLDDVLSLFTGKAHEKGIELAVFVSDRVPAALVGDAGRIRQIITNLMGNSIKFTEHGHIYVTAHLVEEMASSSPEEDTAADQCFGMTLSGFPVANRGRNWEALQVFMPAPPTSGQIGLVIAVEDTGVGIPYEAQSRIFTPFMQVGSSAARVHGGTGIGLSISKCLVGLMKGKIGFVSKPNVGSTFAFTAILAPAPYASDDDRRPSEFEGTSAIVVDHRPVRGRVAKYHLQRFAIQAEVVGDLGQAICKINAKEVLVKLVLIDKETWLKQSAAMPSTEDWLQPDSPKLFLMENPSTSGKVGSGSCGNFNVIMKPLRASMLQVSLRRALGFGERNQSQAGPGQSSPVLGNLLDQKRILVVDDNAVNLKVAAGALRKYGAEVTCVNSGRSAIALLTPPHEFDACFMDIQMPELDGFEATRRIRMMEERLNSRQPSNTDHDPDQLGSSSGAHWHTPILAMTADIIQATHEECLKSGMDGYVSKPFEGEQLYREVARFFMEPLRGDDDTFKVPGRQDVL